MSSTIVDRLTARILKAVTEDDQFRRDEKRKSQVLRDVSIKLHTLSRSLNELSLFTADLDQIVDELNARYMESSEVYEQHWNDTVQVATILKNFHVFFQGNGRLMREHLRQVDIPIFESSIERIEEDKYQELKEAFERASKKREVT